MIRINKTASINWMHIVGYDESEQDSAAMLHLSTGKSVYCNPEYWPAVKAQLISPTDREFEVLGALRYLDEFALKFNISADMKTLDIPEGKTVSEVLIALAKALRENAVSPQDEQ